MRIPGYQMYKVIDRPHEQVRASFMWAQSLAGVDAGFESNWPHRPEFMYPKRMGSGKDLSRGTIPTADIPCICPPLCLCLVWLAEQTGVPAPRVSEPQSPPLPF